LEAIDLQHHEAITKACESQVWQLKQRNTSRWELTQDWMQELYAHCYSKKPRFDPARASMRTFYTRIAENAALDIGRKITRELKLLVYQEDIDLRTEASANDSTWSERSGDCEDDPAQVNGWELSISLDQHSSNEFKAELQDAVSKMPSEMKDLYIQIEGADKISDAERASVYSKATFYRKRETLCGHLVKAGVWSPKEKPKKTDPFLQKD
jgi:DNA-directed RNA polymerase specialized sigma24 family protein